MEKYIEQIAKSKRIAIMGGTFDPIHYGHLVTAEAVRNEFNIELVIFIPSGNPPHKLKSDVTPNEHRYIMTTLATAANPYFHPSRIEMERSGKTYTIDTIIKLREICDKKTKIFFITGADAISQILTWKDADKLLSLCNFVAVTRPGYNNEALREHLNTVLASYKPSIHFLEVPALAISSTDIRNRVALEKPIKYLLPEEVEKYIYKYDLYKLDDTSTDKYAQIKKYLKKVLSEKRYIHTLGVASEAIKLSEHYGIDKHKVYIAGLLHDCAKEFSSNKTKKLCKEYGIQIDDIMKKQLDLVHGFLGAEIAKREFGIEDEDILNAIKYHTTGRKKMTMIEKVIAIADAIEPNRKIDEKIVKIRLLVYENIDEAMFLCLNYKIGFNQQNKNRIVHPLGLEALEYYKNIGGN